MSVTKKSAKSAKPKPKGKQSPLSGGEDKLTTIVGIPVQITIVVPIEIPINPSSLKSDESVYEYRLIQGENNQDALEMVVEKATDDEVVVDALSKLLATALLYKQSVHSRKVEVYFSAIAGITEEQKL